MEKPEIIEKSRLPDLKPLTTVELITIKGGCGNAFDKGKDKRKRPTGS